MIPVPAGTQIWVACGATDMRKGFDGLSMLAQDVLKRNPYSGHLFVFRGKRLTGSRFYGGTGLGCAFTPSDWSAADLFGR